MTEKSYWPLKIKTINAQIEMENNTSQINTEETAKSLVKNKITSTAKVVLWLNNAVIFGWWRNGEFLWAEPQKIDFLQFVEMRVFNSDEELYITHEFNRYRKDEDNGDDCFIETRARLWGKYSCNEEYYIPEFKLLKDAERKIKLIVPCNEQENSTFYELITRNYIGMAEETGQAGYVDYRFVDIVGGEDYNHGNKICNSSL